MALAWLHARSYALWGNDALWFGRTLIVAGLAIMMWSALAFWRARTTIIPHMAPSALVETGPYRYSRNPIYLADLIILGGWALSLGTPVALVLLVPFYAVLLWIFILPEERRLTEHLGRPYTDYCARVRRWI